jgi:hypothetical protein
MADADGVEHTFEFRSMLVATGHALHARETTHVTSVRPSITLEGRFPSRRPYAPRWGPPLLGAQGRYRGRFRPVPIPMTTI